MDRQAGFRGHTSGMKTAVSIPDAIFERVERLAERERKSLSAVYSAALHEYVLRHDPDEITEAMNRTCEHVGAASGEFVSATAHRVLERTEW